MDFQLSKGRQHSAIKSYNHSSLYRMKISSSATDLMFKMRQSLLTSQEHH